MTPLFQKASLRFPDPLEIVPRHMKGYARDWTEMWSKIRDLEQSSTVFDNSDPPVQTYIAHVWYNELQQSNGNWSEVGLMWYGSEQTLSAMGER